MRVFSLALLAAVAIGAAGATTGFAPFDGSGAKEEIGPNNARLLGIHHFSLRDGVTPEEFERFVVEEFNPTSNSIPGIHGMVMKAERNASGGEYLAVYDIQSVAVRDWYWPTPDSTAAVYGEFCNDACNAVLDRFSALTEGTGYVDYVEIARD